MKITYNEFIQKIQNRTNFGCEDYWLDNTGREGTITCSFDLPDLKNIEIYVEETFEVGETCIYLNVNLSIPIGPYDDITAEETIKTIEQKLTVIDEEGNEIESEELYLVIKKYISEDEYISAMPESVKKSAGILCNFDDDRYELIGEGSDEWKFPTQRRDLERKEFKIYQDTEDDTYICQVEKYHGSLAYRDQEECDDLDEIEAFFKKHDEPDLFITKEVIRDANMMNYDEYGINDDTPEDDIMVFEIDGQMNDVKLAGSKLHSCTSYDPFNNGAHTFNADVYQTGAEEFIVIKHFNNILNFPFDEYAFESEEDFETAKVVAEAFVETEEPIFKGKVRTEADEDMLFDPHLAA